MSYFFRKSTFLLSILAISLFFSQAAFANGLSIGVSPLILEIEADPGETIVEKITLDANSNLGGINISTEVKDFYYDNNDELQFLTPEEAKDPELSQFTLKDWISVDEEIYINGKSKEVSLTVQVPNDALPGGRYGMVLFSKGAASDNSSEGANVGVGGKVGVMVLVSVKGEYSSEGGIMEGLKSGRISEDKLGFKKHRIFAGGSLFKNGPIDFRFKYQNNSPTHEIPQGFIEVKNIFGGEVGTFNFEAKRVFPGVSRSIYGTLNKDFLFGIYRAKLTVIDGDSNEYVSSTTFFGLPGKLILLIILFFVFMKYYNQWIINRALNAKDSKNAKKKK